MAIGSIPQDPSQTVIQQHINNKAPRGRLHFFGRLAQTILLRPITTTATLASRVVKLLTWDLPKAALYKVSGHHKEAAAHLEQEYLKTVKAGRDVLFMPSVATRAFKDMVASREKVVDDIKMKPPEDYLKVSYTKSFQLFTSYIHGCEAFEVIKPQGIGEFPAASDAALNTVMASHFLKPDMMAINFGSPNVATFVTETAEDGNFQTTKVDAKSLCREPMTFHGTNGKVQSGVFLIPKNLPTEALQRFKDAAEKLKDRKDITCVNTNSRVLHEAGFSIEGVTMKDIIFPQTLMEHLLFRNVFYTDAAGSKHKVHFDILNTTDKNLEEFFEKVDTDVVGTRLRHRKRNADTEENQAARTAAATAHIAAEAALLAAAPPPAVNNNESAKRKVTVALPSSIGDVFASFWGRHTVYQVDLTDKNKEISHAFQALVNRSMDPMLATLQPFPQDKPSIGTRLKRDFFFSRPMIGFLRRHMMGRANAVDLATQDIFRHLKSTKGARFNYVLLGDKVIFARVHANYGSNKTQKKVADWALSKHALLSGRKDVYCAGEMWYDEAHNRFMMNQDSGTYMPSPDRLGVAVQLANTIFDTQTFGNSFVAELAAAA